MKDDNRRYYGHTTHLDGSHTPLTEEVAKALWDASERKAAERMERYPDALAAIAGLCDAREALRAHGWSDGIYCPKDGSEFAIMQFGSSGIFPARYDGKWPDGTLMMMDGSQHPRGCLFKKIDDLTDAERARMARCVESEKKYIDRLCRSFCDSDEKDDTK